jgi:hypothetical protein
LRKATCSETEGSYCTSKEFLESSIVEYKSIELTKDREPLKFLAIREKFQLSLFEEVKSYFPENTYQNFEIFVPKKMPKTLGEINTYGHYEIQSIADRFGLNPETVSKEWTDLLISMVQEDGYCDKLKNKPESFWPFYLKRTHLYWGEAIKRLIRIVLVLPASSADAERSFSIMNHIKYDRRASMTSKTLDNLMRLRINGPKQLDRLASAKYARAWVQAGHMRTDDPNQQRKRTHDEISNNDDDDETTGKIFMTSDLF